MSLFQPLWQPAATTAATIPFTPSGNIAEKNVLAAIETLDIKTVKSDPTGVTGADQITNMLSLTQAEYDAITPSATTFYVITG